MYTVDCTVDGAGPTVPPPGPPRRGRTWRQAGAILAVAVIAGGGAAAAVIALHPLRHSRASALANSTPVSGRPTGTASGASPPAATVPTGNGPAGTGPTGNGPAKTGPAQAGPAGNGPAGNGQAGNGPTAGAAPVAQAAPPGQQQAAAQVAALLGQSVSDRGAVVQAVSDVSGCGPSLAGDEQTFSAAASSRSGLLSQLGGVPDAATLPAGLLGDLSGAWQSSAAADQDFAGWAQDELANGCTPDDTADPNYQAASGPDDNATADKQAFAAAWNPVAERYGLTQYQWNDL